MEENIYDPDDWSDNSYENDDGYYDTGDTEDEEEYSKYIPDINEEELEDFTDNVREIIEYNKRQINFANRELSSVEGSTFLKHELIDVKDIINKTKNMLNKRHSIDERLSEINPGSAIGWDLQEKQQKRELSLKQQMSSNLAGIKSDTLSDITDDASHLYEDAHDEKGREVRKDIKADLKQLSYSERQEMIERLLEEGRIDQKQYSELRTEFL